LLDRLRASGELDDARRRHAAYYLELAERTYIEMKGANQRAWLDLLETEHDNLRAAMQWSLDKGETSLGERIAAALWTPLWWLQGHVREGLRWLEIFHGSRQAYEDQTDLRVLEGIGMLRAWQGDYGPGKAMLMEALRIAHQWEEEEATVRILAYLGWIFWVNGKTAEAAWLAERLEACSSDLDPWELAYAFLSLGSLLYEASLDEEAEKAFTRALEYFQFTEEKQQGVIWAGHKLALLRHKKGNVLEAKEGMLGALEAARQLNDLHVTAYCTDDAAQLATHRIAGHNRADEPDLEKLARVLGAVDHWREILSLLRTPREKSAYLQVTEFLQRKLGEGYYLRAWQEGRAMPVERVIHEASELLQDNRQPNPRDRQLQEREGIPVRLSEREYQVIGLVAKGLSNQEIGERLFITERTVRFHMTSIFNKLGADNRAQAVAIADRLGIL
jgi:ATP/maltotriose-dependent transcriptional regulator MalT